MKDQDIILELEKKITETISSYMKDVPQPYAIMLSGGYDSGLLAALTKPSIAYRVKFPYGDMWDESIYANAIAKHLNINLTEFVISDEEYKKNFPKAVKLLGEVTTHFSLVPLYIFFEKLQKEGIKHVLCGEGPDEYLGGYPREMVFKELKEIYEIPALSAYQPTVSGILGIEQENSVTRMLFKKYADYMNYSEEDIKKVFPTEESFKNYSLLALLGKLEIELGVVEKMEQKFSQHFGITLHYPYINKDFAEYCYMLPDNLKIRDGKNKWVFKKVAKKYLPSIMEGKVKMGGPVVPMNMIMGWDDIGPYDKSRFILEQKKILGLST